MGGAQFLNAVVHDASVPVVAVGCLLLFSFSVLVTRYHLSSFRLSRLRNDEVGE